MNPRRLFGTRHIEVLPIYKRDGGKCQICGEFVALEECVLDHKIPLAVLRKMAQSSTNDHPLGSSPINAQIAHKRCNMLKGTRGPAQLRLF